MNWLRTSALAVLLLLGGLHAWSSRHTGNVDGISYLDLSDAVSRGDWAGAVNAHWSPLYPMALALGLGLARPTAYWEFAAVHAVNFAIFGAALAAFEYMLRQAIRGRRQFEGELAGLPASLVTGFGYLLFLWASLQLITLSVVSPDMAVAGVVFVAVGLLLSMRNDQTSPLKFGLLGAVLGVGYLVKAPLFPLAFVFLLLAGAVIGPSRTSVARVAVALVVFALVAGPFIVALSVSKGRPTFGESGRLAFAWFVNGVPFRHWQGGEPATGSATHPTRRLLGEPAVYEFATPIGGTYPVWFDPSYWYDGIGPRWNLRDVVRTVQFNLREFQDMLVSWVQGGLILFCGLVAVFGGALSASLMSLRRQWLLLVPALAGLGLYSAVSVFPRYIAPFLVLLWLGVLLSIRMRSTLMTRRGCTLAAALAIAVLTVHLGREIGPRAADGVRDLWHGDAPAEHTLWQVAEGLRDYDIQPGDRLAILHPEPARASWIGLVGWARLARARIVAEVPPEESAAYWAASLEARHRVHRTLAASGARAVVTMRMPAGAPDEEWRAIGTTGYFIMMLPAAAAAVPVS